MKEETRVKVLRPWLSFYLIRSGILLALPLPERLRRFWLGDVLNDREGDPAQAAVERV